MYEVGIYEEILFPAVSSSVNDSILSLCIVTTLACVCVCCVVSRIVSSTPHMTVSHHSPAI